MPISYMQRTRERYGEHRPYRWVVNHDAPWAPLRKPLRECRVALLSSGGFHLDGQPPFRDNEATYRKIPRDANVQDLRIYHHAYRDDDADRDPNCVFPLERFREFASAGVIKELADFAITFIPLYSSRLEIRDRAPKIAAEVEALGADVAFLVPV